MFCLAGTRTLGWIRTGDWEGPQKGGKLGFLQGLVESPGNRGREGGQVPCNWPSLGIGIGPGKVQWRTERGMKMVHQHPRPVWPTSVQGQRMPGIGGWYRGCGNKENWASSKREFFCSPEDGGREAELALKVICYRPGHQLLLFKEVETSMKSGFGYGTMFRFAYISKGSNYSHVPKSLIPTDSKIYWCKHFCYSLVSWHSICGVNANQMVYGNLAERQLAFSCIVYMS